MGKGRTDMQKSSEFTWVQRDGAPIHVREMSDDHLLNTIRLLRRWSKRLAGQLNGDSAATVWEADDAMGMYWFEDDEFAEHHPTWKALQFERRARGLDEKTG